MKNRNLSEKIKDLKQQLDQVTQEITDVHYENANEQIFNISLEKKEFLEKANSEISKSLDILDDDNEKLFSKVLYLKNEVEKAIENFDKESHFLDLFKKFINSNGDERLLLKEFENKESNKISSSRDEILVSNDSDNKFEKLSEQLKKLELLNKSALKHLDSSSDNSDNKENVQSVNDSENFIPLNLFSEIHSVFELEIKKISNINSNKQKFLNDLFGDKFLTKDQKIEKITGKITIFINEFNKNLNSLFNSTNAGGTKKEIKIVKESYKNTISNSYIDLQNELINQLDKIETPVLSTVNKKNDSIFENGINYIDTNNIDELEKAISELESKINLQKVKYCSSESGKESLDYYLYLNHVDKVSVDNEISKNYFNICEEFIKKLELKKEVLQKLVENFVIYVDDNCNQMIVNISDELESAQKAIANDDDNLSNNNFFAQKSIEFFENLKANSNEIFNLLNEKFSQILENVSLESLKTNTVSFEYLLVLINDSIKEINTKVFHVTNILNRELAKISELNEVGLDGLKFEIADEANQIFSYLNNSYLELEEISKDVEKNIKENLKFKLNKFEQVYSYVSNYQENSSQNDFEGFENSSNYVGIRLERLERQFSKIVNLLNPIAEKVSTATNVENLESIESRINSKIDQLISNIENNRNDDESKYSAAVNEILLSNEVHKQNILNLIQSIEEEKLNIISEESKKAVIENGQKLSELEQLIDVQNQEIEALLTEKNTFIEEIEDILINKKHKLNDEKIENIKSAIKEVIFNFNERIDDFEYNFDRKLSTIDLNSLNLVTQKDQKDLFEEIEKRLSNNYEVIKEEVKQDLFQVLNSVSELNSKFSEAKNDESYNERFNEINNQFDQFRFLLKEVTDNLMSKNNKQYDEINTIVENLNNKFINLIEDLKDENIKSGQIIIDKVFENTDKFKEEFDSSIINISNRLSDIANDIENKNKDFENAHIDAIQSIIETNRNNQKEILGYIKNIEDNNERFLTEIEAKKFNLENLKLKNLEELIELQNNEIEALIDEKNNFVVEIEKYVSEQKEKLTNENILKLENSIQDVVNVLNAKIDDLEVEFGRKLQDLDLSSLTSYFDYFDKNQNDFINSVQSQLSNNYEVIKSEFKNDIESVLSSVKEIPSKMDYLHKFDDRFNEINSQFEQFRFILKNTTENILDKDSKSYKEINDVINTLNSKFHNLISELKDENLRTVDLLNEKIATSQEEVNRKIDSSVDLIDGKFGNFLNEVKEQNKQFETSHFDAINLILETNRNNQKEILGYIKNIEDNNERFLTEIEAKKFNLENLKLKNLEELIELQNNEIEALINEKNNFVVEIEKYVSEQKEKLTNENILKLEDSIQDVVNVLNAKIDDLEVEFGRKLQDLDLSSLTSYFDYFDKNQNDFINSVQSQLSNNYEVIKSEFKNDIESVLNSVKEIPSKMDYSHKFNDDRFNEINSQFEQFRFILKNTTENILDKNSKTYKEVNDVMNTLNNKFQNLISELKDENSRTVDLLNEKIATSQEEVNRKIDSSVDLIDGKFGNFLNEVKEQNKQFETSHFDAINLILETNRNNQKEILGYIKNIEDNNERFLSEIEAKKFDLENLKLKNLEELIELQNNEIEELIDEKNNFIDEIQEFILNKKEKLTNENILKLEDSIQNVVNVLNAKIDDLEVEFGRKLQDLDLSSLTSYFDYFDKNQNDFINSVQSQLSNNYEVIKSEFKNDIESVLSSVKEIPSKMDYLHKFDDRFNEINSQFEQFRFILKNTTENILDKDSKSYKEINDVMNTLNNKFQNLISELKDENLRTVDLLNEKIATSQEEVNRKIDSSVDLIDDKFGVFLKEIKEQNKYFENTQFDTIQSIIETNKANQKEILGYIKNLEQTNAEFLNEIDARRINEENLHLKELEELISLQNQEIENLLDEKEDFISEIETFLLNKKNKLDSEHIDRLEDSIKITMANFSDKITELERGFDKKIAEIDLSSVSSLISNEQANLFDSIQDSLSYNYELVRNEFKDNLTEVLNTISALSEFSDSKLGQIESQLENFRLLLKEVTEGFINKEEKHYSQIDDIVSNLNEEFKKVIKSIEIQNKKTGNYISNNIKNNNRKLLKKIDSSLSEMNANFDNLFEDLKITSKIIENNHIDTIETILEINNNSKKEIFEFINLLKGSNQKLVNDILQIQNKKDTLKLQELEELIDIQNQELEALIDDKNDFINEIEEFIRSSKSKLTENHILKLEDSIDNLVKAFNKKIDELEISFNEKFVNIDFNSLNNSLQDNQSQTLKEIREQLVSNYEIIKNILKSDLNKIIEDIKNHNVIEEQNFEKINNKFNEFKNALQKLSLSVDNSSLSAVNSLANSLNNEFDDLVDELKSKNSKTIAAKMNDSNFDLKVKVENSLLSNAKFDLFINKLDEKITLLEQNRLVGEFKNWWDDFKNSNSTLFNQGDSINLVLDSNKINQIQINKYIKKLEKENNYLENKLKKEQEKFSILKIKEIEELIDLQNSEISTLLNDWEKLIFELERYLQNILNIANDKNTDEFKPNDILNLNNSLSNVINNFKSKVDLLENNFKNKISDFNENIDSVENEEILKIEKNLYDNYLFLKDDLENIFKNILFKIEEIKNSKDKYFLKSKINDLINEVQNIKNANNTSVQELNDKNLLLEKIENFVTEKFEKKTKENKEIKDLYANNDFELTEKLNKLDNWYSNLINHIETNNKDVISAYVDNKINEIKIENNIDNSDLSATYHEVVFKLSEISNLLNLSKDNISKIFKNLFKNFNGNNQLSNLLAELNKIILTNNKIIGNLSYQNDKYLESINLANNKNTLFEIGKELVGVLDLLSKSQSLLNADFANFELEQKALGEILLKPFDERIVENFIVRITDLLKNNMDLLTRLFFNFESKKDANLIKLHAIQDSLRIVNQELTALDNFEITKSNYVSFNKKLDEIKNILLISHLDLKIFKESEIEKTLLSSNSDVLKIEFKKIILLEDLIKYSKDYLKNILNQKNKLVKFLMKENLSNDENCLIEFRASQLYSQLSAKVTEDQVKGFNEIIKEFEKNSVNSENKTDLISAKNLKHKALLYSKISELELEIAKLFDAVEKKKKVFVDILSDALLNQSDSEIEKIVSRFEDSKEMIQNEYFQELEAFKNQIFSFKEKELNDFKNEILNIENEIINFKNSDKNLLSQKTKELEPLDNLIEELHLEISSFEQEKENHYKDVAEKLAYLNSLGSSKEKSIEDTVNTDKFKINLNNEVKEMIENEFMSLKTTFLKNLDQIKNGFNLIKSSYTNSDNEIDNPSWFTSFDEKIKNIESGIVSEKINSQKNINKNNNNNIELKINGDKVKGFIVETESRKKEIEDFYNKISDLIKLRRTKKENS